MAIHHCGTRGSIEQHAVAAPDPAGAQQVGRLATQRGQFPEVEFLLGAGRRH